MKEEGLTKMHLVEQGKSVETVSRDSEEEVSIKWCREIKTMKKM